MKLIKITVPCLVKGKPRQKGDEVEVEDIKALELIGMKVAELKDSVAPKLKPWEQARAKQATEAKKPEAPALK